MTTASSNYGHATAGNSDSEANLELLVEDEANEGWQDGARQSWSWLRYGKGLLVAALVVLTLVSGAAFAKNSYANSTRPSGIDLAVGLISTAEEFGLRLSDATAGRPWSEIIARFNQIARGTPLASDPDLRQLQIFYSQQAAAGKQVLNSLMIRSAQRGSNGTTFAGLALATPTAPATAVTEAPETSLTSTQQTAILAKHNELRRLRAASDMLEMTWDSDIASTAQSFANSKQGNCDNLQHSTVNTGFRGDGNGENLAMAAGTGFIVDPATHFETDVQNWYNEESAAGTYQNGGSFSGWTPCTGTCGHYTQVVWHTANLLGCGVTPCTDSGGRTGYILVCQYGTSVSGATGGNTEGGILYTPGAECDACPSGFDICNDQLCAAR